MIQGLGPKNARMNPGVMSANLSDLQLGLQMVAGYGFVDVSPDAQTGKIKVTANLSSEQLTRAKEVIEQLAPYVFGKDSIPDFEFVSLSGAPLASATSSDSQLAFRDSFRHVDAASSQPEAHQGASILLPPDRPASAIDAEKIGHLATAS
jgi:hypothetical protein